MKDERDVAQEELKYRFTAMTVDVIAMHTNRSVEEIAQALAVKPEGNVPVKIQVIEDGMVVEQEKKAAKELLERSGQGMGVRLISSKEAEKHMLFLVNKEHIDREHKDSPQWALVE
jgi:hypothetical protein